MNVNDLLITVTHYIQRCSLSIVDKLLRNLSVSHFVVAVVVVAFFSFCIINNINLLYVCAALLLVCSMLLSIAR